MARHKAQANSRELAFCWPTFVALPSGWQSRRGASRQRAALESESRIKSISDGYDPTIGIMHEGSDGSSKFIFDLMESERPTVDRSVLDFMKGRVFDPGAPGDRQGVGGASPLR